MSAKKPIKKKVLEEEEDDLRAVIVADSYDHRYYPITEKKPRALVPLCNLPMVSYAIEFLILNNIKEVYVFSCAHSTLIKNYFEGKGGYEVTLQSHLAHSDPTAAIITTTNTSNPNLASQATHGQSFVPANRLPMITIHVVALCESMCEGDILREINRKTLFRGNFLFLTADLVSNVDITKALNAHKQRTAENKENIMTVLFKKSHARTPDDRLLIGINPKSNQLFHYQPIMPNTARFALPLDLFDPSYYPPTPPTDAQQSSSSGSSSGSGTNAAAIAASTTKYMVSAAFPAAHLRADLIDCHVAICTPHVTNLFMDNPDFYTFSDGIRGIVEDELRSHCVFSHIVDDKEYMRRANNLVNYEAVSKDLLHRWVYPLTPENSHYMHPLAVSAKRSHQYKYMRDATYICKDTASTIPRNTQISGTTLIGTNVTLGQNVTLKNAVIGNHVTIGDDVVIEGSYLFNHIKVDSNTHISRSFIGSHSEIGRAVTIATGNIVKSNTFVISDFVSQPYHVVSSNFGPIDYNPQTFSNGSSLKQFVRPIKRLTPSLSTFFSSEACNDLDAQADSQLEMYVDLSNDDSDLPTTTTATSTTTTHSELDDSNESSEFFSEDEGGQLAKKSAGSFSGSSLEATLMKPPSHHHRDHPKDHLRTASSPSSSQSPVPKKTLSLASTLSLNDNIPNEKVATLRPLSTYMLDMNLESDDDSQDEERDKSDSELTESEDEAFVPEGYVPDPDQSFSNEVQDSINTGVRENVSCENMILEINSSKHAYNTAPQRVQEIILNCILAKCFEYTERAPLDQHLKASFTRLAPLVSNYFRTAQDQILLLDLLCQYSAVSLPSFVDSMQQLVYLLYNLNVLEEDAVCDWYETSTLSSNNDSGLSDAKLVAHKAEAKARLEKLVAWLKEAEEEGSDDDSDGSSDDESVDEDE